MPEKAPNREAITLQTMNPLIEFTNAERDLSDDEITEYLKRNNTVQQTGAIKRSLERTLGIVNAVHEQKQAEWKAKGGNR